VGAQVGDLLRGARPDRLGLLFGERQDLLDPRAEVPERHRAADGGLAAGLGDFELELLHLSHERPGLLVGFRAFSDQRVVLRLERGEVTIDLITFVASNDDVEVVLGPERVAQCGQFSAVRHDTILTRDIPSRPAQHRHDGTCVSPRTVERMPVQQ
jgi:hypothetical protein